MMRDAPNPTLSCDEAQHDLIEFADSTLDGARRMDIERHIEHCSNCRLEVAALRKSLLLARNVWETRAGRVRSASVLFEQRLRRKSTNRLKLATAALALLALSTVVFAVWKANGPSGGTEIAERKLKLPLVTDGGATGETVDVEYFVRREEQAAKLASSVNVLADSPALTEDMELAQRYLERYYSSTSSRKNADSHRSDQGM